MNLASIDIGSNTVLLLIAEYNIDGSYNPLLNVYRSPRLGKGIKSDGSISNESLDKFYAVLDEYKVIIDKFECDTVIAKATNAMRIATNSGVIIKLVKEKYDIDIKIIPGDEEARLSYLGAASALMDEKEKMVIDIGGGSTEIIYGKENEIIYRKSFPIGAVNLTEKFIKDEIVTENEITEMYDFLKDHFAELLTSIPSSLPPIAVAGTSTTLSCMNQSLKEYDELLVETSQLSKTNLETLVGKLRLLRPKEVLKNYGNIVSGREDVILAGSIILHNLSVMLKLDSYTVSGKGIRYGAIEDYLSKHNFLQS